MASGWIVTNRLTRWIGRIWLLPLVRDASVLTLAQYGSKVLGLATAVLAARLLGPDKYGLAAVVMAYPVLVRALLALKSDLVTTRYVAGFRASGQHAALLGLCKLTYGLDFVLGVITVGAVWLTATRWAGEALRAQPAAWLAVAFAASFPFQFLSKTSLSVFASWGLFSRMALFQLAERALTLVLVVGLIRAGFGVAGIVLGTGAAAAAVGVGMLVAATRVLVSARLGLWWRGSVADIRHLWKELIAFAGWNQFAISVGAAAGQLPVLLLGNYWGPAMAGFYRLAATIVTASGYPEDSLRRVVYPTLSARWERGGRAGLSLTLRRWTLTAGSIAAGLQLAVIPLLPMVVPLAFTRVYLPIVPGTQLMLVGAAIGSLLFWLKPLYYSANLVNAWATGYGAYQVALLGAVWFAAARFGFVGVAAATALGDAMFIGIMAWIISGRIARLPRPSLVPGGSRPP